LVFLSFFEKRCTVSLTSYFNVFPKSLVPVPKIEVANNTLSKYSLKKILILPSSYIR
jgi:hypothetical protein